MLTDEQLLALAGKQSFARGRAYHRDGRIALSAIDDDGLAGEAEGQFTYRLRLQRSDTDWRWQCSCPAAADGGFCKHLVAAVLTAREDGPAQQHDAPRASANHPRDELATWLRAQDSQRLADWLLALADEDRHIRARLAMYRASDDPAALKAAIGRVLTVGGFLDYRRTNEFAARLEPIIDALRGAMVHDAAAARTLCEYATGRLLKVYARCDDSAGSVGEVLREIADLHADACRASPPGKALVKSLLALQRADEWELFPLDAYWDALGDAGRRAYGEQVLAEFEALPPADEASRWGEAFAVERRAEALARACGDVDLLLRIIGRRDSRPHDSIRMIEALREFGREREALACAERAVRRFPADTSLRNALVDCLGRAGLEEEALEHAWHAFTEHPADAHWDVLKRVAGGHWPQWRERALGILADAERGHATARVTMLMHDGDLTQAAAIAAVNPVWVDTLRRLADHIDAEAPLQAGAFMLRVATTLAEDPQPGTYVRLAEALARCASRLPDEQWRPLAQRVRQAHGRKRKLIGLLDEAGV